MRVGGERAWCTDAQKAWRTDGEVAWRTDGERAWSEPSTVQPGGRVPAPGELALVQAFINSHYDLEMDHGADLFATRRGLELWIARRDPLADTTAATELTGGDVSRAVAVREGLRTLASINGNGADAVPADALARLNEAARGAAWEMRLADGGPKFVPVGRSPLDRAIGAVLAATAAAMIDGSWARLKVCPGEHCGWAFYDHSRNQSGRWCSMSVCGGRAKARTHYRRRRGGE
jgi:predicted RNA-binding Zn ribbon-like protein